MVATTVAATILAQTTAGRIPTKVYRKTAGGTLEEVNVVTLGSDPEKPPSGVPDMIIDASNIVVLSDPDGSTGPLTEVSGLIVSYKNGDGSNIMWVHNDSGHPEVIYAIMSDKLLAQYELTGATHGDWEDMSWGPGPDSTKAYIYVANCGLSAGSNTVVHRVVEPTVTTSTTPTVNPISIPSSQRDTFTFTRPTDNCEAFTFDPITGDAFWIEKRDRGAVSGYQQGEVAVYRAAGSQFMGAGGPVTFSLVGKIKVNISGTIGPTAADITRDGKYLAIRNYQEIVVWKRDPSKNEKFQDLLVAKPEGDHYFNVGSSGTTESLGFNTAGTRVYEMADASATAKVKYRTITYENNGNPSGDDWRTNSLMMPPTGKVVFSAHIGEGTNRPALETKYGHQLLVFPIYADAINLSGPGAAQDALNRGDIPRLDFPMPNSFGPHGVSMTNADGLGNSLWKTVGLGHFDDPVTLPDGQTFVGMKAYFDAIGELTAGACPSNKIYLTLNHEADLLKGPGKPCGGGFNGVRAGTAPEFRMLWQHCWQLAKDRGVTNIVWVLNFAFDPNAGSGEAKWGEVLTNTDSDGMYPGHQYVDWFAYDPYQRPGGSKWLSFKESINKQGQLAWWNRHFSVGGNPVGPGSVYKPIMLAETGTVERTASHTSGAPGDASDWIRAIGNIPGEPEIGERIKMVVYYSRDTGVAAWALSSAHTQKWAGVGLLGNGVTTVQYT